jgi:CDP-glycerol glycerophosphotransferase
MLKYLCPPMPSLSLVLVAHREQAYLPECVASIRNQGFADVEIVAIDDASPDHGPGVLDDLARDDARMRVEHLPERVGVGAARNLALELVEGGHVWFIEPTDLVAPGALAAVLERLEATAPEVLVVGHERTGPLGPASPGPHAGALAGAAERDPGPLEGLPALADAAPGAWDKVLRTAFVRDLGLRFGAGAHDELSVTWPALLAAERIAALPREAYVRREVANGPRDPRASALDLFVQCDAVLAFVRAHDELPEARRELVGPAMVRHQLALLGRVPARDRREFFARMSRSLREQGLERPAAKGRLGQVRVALVRRHSYRAFELLQGSLRAQQTLAKRGSAAGRRARRVAGGVHDATLRPWYRLALRRPIDPDLAVFAAYWYRGYSCNPRAIYEKARELVPGMRGVWIVKPDALATFPEDVEHVVAGTREYFETIARARYLVNNVNFPNHLVKREGSVHVMTHHGTPLKLMGIDQRATPAARMDFGALLSRCARWDYSVSSNPHSTLVWEHTYPTRYETLEVGYPRNDVLATATDDQVRRVREELGIPPDQVAILYAPTHREYQREYVPTLDVGAVADGLGPDHVVLARLHYFYDADPRLRKLHAEGRVRDVSDHPSVEELCLAADVLLTDYSSIMFDYAVLDRPILIHAPDWEAYRAIRGTYFDLMAEPPGAVATTEGEVLDALRSGRVSGDDARRLRAAFRARFCSLEDGHAAERVVRRVWLGERDAVTQPEPSLTR